mgnify:CR=1 FL=1
MQARHLTAVVVRRIQRVDVTTFLLEQAVPIIRNHLLVKVSVLFVVLDFDVFVALARCRLSCMRRRGCQQSSAAPTN